MINENKKSKIFTRRAFVLGATKTVFLSTLVGRLYYLQVLKAKEYTTLSDSNRIKLFLIPPLRGRILDRNDNILATNKNYYRVLFDPQYKEQAVESIKKLVSLLQLSNEYVQKFQNKIVQHNSRNPLLLWQYLTWKDVSKIEVNAPELPGIFIDVGQVRSYPTGNNIAHSVGYLGPVTQSLIATNPLLNHPDFKVGKAGAESIYEEELRGKAGVKRMEVDAFGLAVRELSREESIPGKHVKLTLDKKIVDFAAQRIKGLSAGVVVMDVHKGDVLCMVSTPSFDPHQFTYGVNAAYWKALTSNPDHPLINKTIATQYPPGSTFKMVVALAALKEGIDPDMQVFCPGYVMLGRTRFHCWKEEGHKHVNMRKALQQSCNAYFYTIAKRIGIDPIENMAKKLGLGVKTGFPIRGEKPGLVPSRTWKKKRFNIPWQTGDTLNVGIGQGFLLSTPLQLAQMTARLATGKQVEPHFKLLEPEEPISPYSDLDIKQEHLQIIRDGLFRVVNIPGGTAYGSRIPHQDFIMAGKTGTSQVISKKKLKKQENTMTEEERKRSKHHAIFVGYAPYKQPKYALSVIVEHGGSGSAAAAPIARDIMTFIRNYEKK